MFESQAFKDKLAGLVRRHEEVSALLGTAEVINKRAEFLKLSREHADLDPLVAAWKAYEKLVADLAAAKQMADAEQDPELRELAREEAKELENQKAPAEQALKILLLPKDPNDAKNTIVEIRVNESLGTFPRIYVYANDAPDPSGYGEGQYFLGLTGSSSSSDRQFTFRHAGDLRGKWVTATAMQVHYYGWLRTNGERQGFATTSSEFSRAVEVK